MTRGIRAFAVATFNATLPQLPEMGGLAFRTEVVALIMAAFDISRSSASTHYNFALIQARTTAPEAVKGLGRPEGKKGGRKAKAATEPVVVSDAAAAVAETANAEAVESTGANGSDADATAAVAAVEAVIAA